MAISTKLIDYLSKFNAVADEWFPHFAFVKQNYDFFQEFTKLDNLRAAQWEDFQKIGYHLHELRSNHLLRKKAFGQPHHDITYYRRVFIYLVRGGDPDRERIQRVFEDAEFNIKGLNQNTLSEMIGYIFADSYTALNEPSEAVARHLGIELTARDYVGRFFEYNAAVDTFKSEYARYVGWRTGWPTRLELGQFINFLFATYGKEWKMPKKRTTQTPAKRQHQTWVAADAYFPDLIKEFHEKGYVAMGYSEVGDISSYTEKKELIQALRTEYNYTENPAQKHANALYAFAHLAQPGDVLFIKSNGNTVYGVGEITSGFEYRPDLIGYCNTRRVDWHAFGYWKLPDDVEFSLPYVTFGKITKETKKIQMLQKLLQEKSEASNIRNDSLNPASVIRLDVQNTSDVDTAYFWLYANPKVWDIASFAPGQKQVYTTHNDKGHKRQIYNCFQKAKPDDLIIGYASTPRKRITTMCRVSRGIHTGDYGEAIEIEVVAQLALPVTRDELLNIPSLVNAPFQGSKAQGSLYELTPEEYWAIREVIANTNPGFAINSTIDEPGALEIETTTGTESTTPNDSSTIVPPESVESHPAPATSTAAIPEPETITPYTIQDAHRGLFITKNDFEAYLNQLRAKKNIIIQGPPGVGKSYMVKRLAYALMNAKDPDRVTTVQFHQSYGYEDFVQGLRPTEHGGFAVSDGVFYSFCQRARTDLDQKYVFVIDEINRGNLSRILGELLMLIEADKRRSEFAAHLTYASPTDEPFYVPPNVYIIGLMNTADRSLAMVDYALRRRFSFITLRPAFDSAEFDRYLKMHGVKQPLRSKITTRMKALNTGIATEERDLGAGFCIGHSFFCPDGSDRVYDEAWYKEIIVYDIQPLLEEYWFNDKQRARQEIAMLLAE